MCKSTTGPNGVSRVSGARGARPLGVRAAFDAGATDHTCTGAIKSVDGREPGEAGLAGAVAGHFGVPAVLLSGDRAATEEALDVSGDLEVAAVKDTSMRSSPRGGWEPPSGLSCRP